MLKRQKTILALLLQMDKPLKPTVFVKLMFLLRQEMPLNELFPFYDFLPYRYGPFSFCLYRELSGLRMDGYILPDDKRISLCEDATDSIKKRIKELPAAACEAVSRIIGRYGNMSASRTLFLKDIYARYPWYATRSELRSLREEVMVCGEVAAAPAVYTTGYEGKSVDAFFDGLMRKGIKAVIDVRANPLSRCYGFSKKKFAEIAQNLGIGYRHVPSLGIPSEYRRDLSDFNSYQRLMERYERELLPCRKDEVIKIGISMKKTATVLMCLERDYRCCHRSRLAEAVSLVTGLEVENI